MREASEPSGVANSPVPITTSDPDATRDRPTLNARFPASDVANAGRLVALFGDCMRYCHPWRCWLIWDGKRWAEDQTGAAMRLAKRVVQTILDEATPNEQQPRCRAPGDVANLRRLKTMLLLAAPELPILPAELDGNPWLLNCDNGTLDLRTGELRDHRKADFMTRLCPTPYLPDEPHEDWDRFTASVFVNPSVVDFLKRFLGYCLTGDVREQFLPIFWGAGANGKSTLLETFLHVLGSDYAMKAPADLLIVKKNAAHPTERADLFGKRFVACVESGSGRGLNETFVKELTGGDSIRARRLYEDYWQFLPTHKVVLCTNHVPEVRGIDHAIWRRLALVPFPVTFWDADKGESGPPERAQDKSLPERLRHEAAGILAWCVQGCRDWQSQRLKLPPEVIAATERYRTDQDVVSEYIDDRCIVEEKCQVRASELYTAFMFWCVEHGSLDIGHQQFGAAMGKRFEKYVSNGVWYKGIRLADKI